LPPQLAALIRRHTVTEGIALRMLACEGTVAIWNCNSPLHIEPAAQA